MRITDFCDLIAHAEGKRKSAVNAAQMREILALCNAAISHSEDGDLWYNDIKGVGKRVVAARLNTYLAKRALREARAAKRAKKAAK